MSDPAPGDREGLSPTIVGHIELICDRFESAWRGEAKPRIEVYWQEADGPDLLRELLVLELAYRIKGHDHPEPADYHPRFAAHAKVIRDAFEAVPACHRSPGPHAPTSSRASADRNLLFGVLAMQMDFVTREALIAAVSTWALDKSKPLDQILVEHGALSADERDLLEPLIHKHLERHGGDAGRSLASVGSRRPAREALGHITDPALDASLALLDDVDATASAADKPGAIRFFAQHPGAQRFHVLRPLARGGLGEVFVARDEELHREVALKLIQERHASDPGSRTRFEFEAEITGRLEHPGVIPVYGLGVDGRGRPYYAMRFVRGESLKEAIARFQREDGPTREAGERSLAFRELLGRFVDVCNTIAYAHGRGILHRDLKPANVMLGPYGETLVVDWGLAKALGRPAVKPSTRDGSLESLIASDGVSTEPGSWLGTPTFMSPEQAAGRIDQLGPASDIYSLGATLYNLLTGKVAFEGPDVLTLLGKIRAGDFPPPRSVDATIDPALESVCLKAMALTPGDRYCSPQALAEDVERWMADEPVSAWRESLARRARRWAKRNRTAVTAAAVALVAGVVGLSAVLAVQTRANADLTRSRAAVQARYDLAVEAIGTFHTGVSKDFLLTQEQFKDVRDRLLKSASDFYGKLGTSLGKESDLASRRALWQANYEVALLTGFVGKPEDALAAHRQVLAAREALASATPADPEIKLDVGRSLTAVAGWLETTGRTKEAEAMFRKAETLLVELAPATAAAAAARAVLATCRSYLGQILHTTGRDDEALLVYRLARADQEALAASPGATAESRRNLASTISRVAIVLAAAGKTSEAEAEYGKALAIQQRLADDYPAITENRNDLAVNHNNLGLLLSDTGKASEAAAEYRKAVELFQKLADDYPAVTDFVSRVAISRSNLGVLLSLTGQSSAAEAELRKAEAIQRRLAEDHPAVTQFQRNLAATLASIGWQLAQAGKTDDAIGYCTREEAIRQKLADGGVATPNDTDFLANCQTNAADLLRRSRKLDEALAACRRSLALREPLVKAHPEFPDFRAGLGETCLRLGQVERDMENLAGAVAAWKRACAHFDAIQSLSPELTFLRACCHAGLAGLAGRPGSGLTAAEGADQAEKAMAVLRQAVTMGYLNPDAFRTESALDPLRERLDFKLLRMDLAMPAAPFAPAR